MKILEKKVRKVLQYFFKVTCFTSIAFVFQACYGTPEDMGINTHIKGVVTDKNKQPVKGIKVSDLKSYNYELTDSDGKFSIYSTKNSIKTVIRFEDIDDDENGHYRTIDVELDLDDQNAATMNVTLKDVE